MSTSSPEESYDWTFSYKLSRPVYCKESINDNTIKSVKDSGNNLIGFKIEVKNEIESKGRETSKIKAKKLENILTILSRMELKAVLADLERLPKKICITKGLQGFHSQV